MPGGQGEVWNTLKDIGLTGTGMTAGSFTDNLWLGTEQRGLLWAADSDRGLGTFDDRVAAHSLSAKAGPSSSATTSSALAAARAPWN